jgi:hypothetical protein
MRARTSPPKPAPMIVIGGFCMNSTFERIHK